MTPEPATPATPRDVARRIIEDLWGRGETGLVAQLFDSDVVDRMPVPGQAGGHDGLREVVESFHAAFGDLRMQLHGVLVDGAHAVDFWTFRGVHRAPVMGIPATGRPVEFSGVDVHTVADGRVTQMWHVEEMWRLARQLTDPYPGVWFGVVPWASSSDAPTSDAPTSVAPASGAPDPDVGRELVRAMIEDVFATGDTSLLDEVFAPDVVDHQPAPGQAAGRQGIVEVLGSFHAAFPDQELTLHGTVADGDLAADWWTFRGTHTGELLGIAPTGRTVEFHGCDVARVRDGRIVAIWHAEELHRMLDQLTSDPAPSGRGG